MEKLAIDVGEMIPAAMMISFNLESRKTRLVSIGPGFYERLLI